MSATVTGVVSGDDVWGRHRVRMVTVTGDASYPTGGYALTGQQMGFRNIAGMTCMGGNTASVGIIPYWNTTTQKLQFLYPTETATSPNVGGDAPSGTNMSGVVFTMLVSSLDN